jgi:hypothetical protein
MRRTRARLTVGTLLWCVAIVAVNCAAYRFSDEIEGLLPEDVRGPAYFFTAWLPLFSVAIFGTAFSVSKLAQRLWTRREPALAGFSAGVTFFSVHFSVLAILGTNHVCKGFMAFPWLLRAYERWWPLFQTGRFGIPAPTWIDVGSIAFFTIILSGPPFLVAAIGGLLARRYARVLSPLRFRGLACAMAIGFACVMLTLLLELHPFRAEQNVEMSFCIVDQESRQPIRGAFVFISGEFWPLGHRTRAVSGPHGRAILTQKFWVKGRRNAFRAIGECSTWGWWLAVDAPGFPRACMPLPDVLGLSADSEAPTATIAMNRGAAPIDAFHDVKGIYQWTDIDANGNNLMISQDGRLGSDNARWGFHPYGMVSRRDGKLVLRIFPHLGKDVDPSMRSPYLPIRWRGQTYLASTEDSDLRGFCRAAILAYRRGCSLSARNVYVRKFDEEQEGAGLPSLPISVWWRFVVAELTFQDFDGLLSTSLRNAVRRSVRIAGVPSSWTACGAIRSRRAR